MPQEVVNAIAEALKARGKAVDGSRILLLGMAYKKTWMTCASRLH